MVEDILQASLPSFVDAVRIADIGQGTNPVRIVSMRALPDMPGHPDYPREEWVGLNQDAQSKAQAKEVERVLTCVSFAKSIPVSTVIVRRVPRSIASMATLASPDAVVASAIARMYFSEIESPSNDVT